MTKLLSCALVLICSGGLWGHPMGNYSVNHYTRLQVSASGIEIQYVLDLAEIPTFELLRSWKLAGTSPRAELKKRAAAQAKEWLNQLAITCDGKALEANLQSTDMVIADGAGNLPIVRITAHGHVDAAGGDLAYEDHNFPDRAGWKEIVISSEPGVNLRTASQSDRDISNALTKYPPNPAIAPPQDLRAEMRWSVDRPIRTALRRPSGKTAPTTAAAPQRAATISGISQPHLSPAAAAPASMTSQAAPPGTLVRGDFLSKLLHQREITPWMMLVAIVCAFALGAAHALTPGHGKTIVAAYLVGSRGTLKHAAFLGAMVTFTHTAAVFAVGFAALFLFRYLVPEKITETLGAASGICIVVVGAWMVYKRITTSRPHSHSHHSHDHVHHHHRAHNHSHDHGHTQHEHNHHNHAPQSHSHSHVPNELSWAGLVALGVSGGLVPCESALVLLLGAIALGRVGLGLLMLLSFSLGLALVLMTIGILVLYAKNLLPERKRTADSFVFRCISIASPAIVMVVGLIMTGISLGWIQAKWAIG